MTKFLVILVLLLSGCASTPARDPFINSPVRIDARAFELCRDLTFLNNDPTYQDLINNTITLAEAYLDCRRKQEVSVKLLKQFSGKEQQ